MTKGGSMGGRVPWVGMVVMMVFMIVGGGGDIECWW